MTDRRHDAPKERQQYLWRTCPNGSCQRDELCRYPGYCNADNGECPTNGPLKAQVSEKKPTGETAIDRDWWRLQGREACIDRMVLMNEQRLTLERENAALKRDAERFRRLKQYGGAVTVDRGEGSREVRLQLWWLDDGSIPVHHENWVASFDAATEKLDAAIAADRERWQA